MSREWISKKDQRWVMCCNQCDHRTEPRATQNDLPLEEFAQAGWFVAKLYGEWCPNCVSEAGGIAALIARGKQPHGVMEPTS
jgi:hypothetical protein